MYLYGTILDTQEMVLEIEFASIMLKAAAVLSEIQNTIRYFTAYSTAAVETGFVRK